MIYDIIIIGAGTAGLTASIYGRRAGKSVLVLEKETFGGQIVYSPAVENYPGIPSVSGNEFADSLLSQAEALGAETDLSGVEKLEIIEKDGAKMFRVTSEYGEYTGRTVIIATGASHRPLRIEREEELTGSGVSYCALCDGAFCKDRPVAVVGGGDTACQDAVYLAGVASKVYLIHRRGEFRAERSNVEKAAATGRIEFVMDSEVTSLNGRNELESISVRNKLTGNVREIKVNGLFVAVGQTPATAVFKDIVALDANGYVIAGEDCRTNVPGIFAAGDVRTKKVRQLTTAAADGAVAATGALELL